MVGIGRVIVIWIKVTYLPSQICLLRVGCGGAGAGCVLCYGFIHHNNVIYSALVFLLFNLGESCFGGPVVDVV